MDLERFPRSLIRKLEMGAFPLRVLGGVRELREYLDRVEAAALREARRLGASPSDIAGALGITRQGVHHKLKRLDAEAAGETEPVVIVDLEPEREGSGQHRDVAPR